MSNVTFHKSIIIQFSPNWLSETSSRKVSDGRTSPEPTITPHKLLNSKEWTGSSTEGKAQHAVFVLIYYTKIYKMYNSISCVWLLRTHIYIHIYILSSCLIFIFVDILTPINNIIRIYFNVIFQFGNFMTQNVIKYTKELN